MPSPSNDQFTGPRDMAYTFQMAAEKAEWLAAQVRVHGGLPVYDALTILTEQAELFRRLESEARAQVARRVDAIRGGVSMSAATSAGVSGHYLPDPDALTDAERAMLEAWNAAYPADAVTVDLAGNGKLMYRATFEPEWRKRWLELKTTMTKGDGE